MIWTCSVVKKNDDASLSAEMLGMQCGHDERYQGLMYEMSS